MMPKVIRKKAAATNKYHPYIDLTSSSDEEDPVEMLDVRIFQGSVEFPRHLHAEDKVRAKNGYVWLARDRDCQCNTSHCSYLRVVPTRGNRIMCGRSGPLGNFCSNRCTYSTVSAEVIGENAKERWKEYQDDPDLAIKANSQVQYRMMLTPKKRHVIDAVFFGDIMYKGLDKKEKNYQFFTKLSKQEQLCAHDKFLLIWINGRIHGCLSSR